MTSPTKSTTTPAKIILLVGNHRAGAAARKVVLEEQGFLVRTTTTAEEALESFHADPCDLVITAYRLGAHSIDGVELIAQLRTLRSGLPAVLLSGVAEVLGLNERNTGADAVIQKSATEVTQMLRVVNRLLRRNTPRKPPALQVLPPSPRRAQKSS